MVLQISNNAEESQLVLESIILENWKLEQNRVIISDRIE